MIVVSIEVVCNVVLVVVVVFVLQYILCKYVQGERFELSNPLRERALNPSHLAKLCYPCIDSVLFLSVKYISVFSRWHKHILYILLEAKDSIHKCILCSQQNT